MHVRLPSGCQVRLDCINVLLEKHNIALLLRGSHVYGVDCSSIIEKAQEIVKVNGFEVRLFSVA